MVYRARRPNGEAVALKVLFPPPGVGPELLARFEREARTAARLNHPAIVRVLDVGHAADHPYMAMTLVEGQTLSMRLAQVGKFDEAIIADIAWQIADALYYAHRLGVVHRDVKPSNILLTDQGRALLTDFGVAQAFDDVALTRTGHTVGTPAYMAPEQAIGSAEVDGRADLYSLGVVLYQMVTGRAPFQGSTPQVLHAHVYQPPPPPSTIAQVSPEMEAIILKAMAKNASERFQTGAAMAQALAQLEDQTSDRVPVTPALVGTRSTSKRTGRLKPGYARQSWRWGIVAILAVIVVTIVWLLMPVVQPSPALPSPTFSPVRLPFPVGSLLKGTGAGVFRLNADGKMQHFYDWPTFLAFGFTEADIQTIDDAALANIPQSGELTRLLQSKDGQIFWVVNGRRWQIKRWQTVLSKTGYLGLPPSPADEALLAALPLAVSAEDLPEGTLVKMGDNLYRMFADGQLRRFITPELAAIYGYQATDFIEIPEEVGQLYPTGRPLTPLLQAEGEDAIFLIADGKRHPMPSNSDELWALGYGIDDIKPVPAEYLESFPLAQVTSTPSPTAKPATAIVAVPPPTATPQPTATSTATTVPTPTPTTCPQPIDPALSALLAMNLNEPLGCPKSLAITSPAAWQPFENGLMLWRQDLNLIYGVGPDEAWFITGDTWRDGDPSNDPSIIVPNGYYQPERGFGKVWRERPGVRAALGWGLTDEVGFTATIQDFTGGQVWRDVERGRFMVLFNSGAYQLLQEPPAPSQPTPTGG